MLRKLLALTLTAFTMLLGLTPAMAEFPSFENQIPDQPIENDHEKVRVTAVYDAAADVTRYTIELKDAALFPDGTAVTADDLLFTWYVYLDPGYQGETDMRSLEIVGLENYLYQMSEARYDAALEMIAALEAAGPDHVHSEEDGWTQAQQDAYRALKDEYDAACAAQYPVCVQNIVDVCTEQLLRDGVGAFGLTAEEVAASEGLKVANAMMVWGYASWKEGALTSSRTRTVWQMNAGILPTADEFAEELKAVYGNDLAACWSVETTGEYEPALPDWKDAFLKLLAAEQPETVCAVSGIRKIDDRTVEVELAGIDMRSDALLLAIPTLSLRYGSEWNPEAGVYGHPYGDVSAIERGLAGDGSARTVRLMEVETIDTFFF